MNPGRMMGEVLSSIFKKPATNLYPAEKLEMPDNFRGRLVFDPQKCTGCRLCMKDCPSGAITIHKTGEKQFEAVIDLGRCIYCAQCVDSCPKKAITSTKEVELAQLDVKNLRMVFRGESKEGIKK